MAPLVKLIAIGALGWAVIAGALGITHRSAPAPQPTYHAAAMVPAVTRPTPSYQEAPGTPRMAQRAPQAAQPLAPAPSDLTQRIVMRAFAPVVDLVQAVAYPVCYLMMAAGALLIATGNRSKGIASMKWAAIGYIILQFTPALMQILVGVGDAMRAGG